MQAIALLVEHGVETPDGPIQPAARPADQSTANRYLGVGYDHERMTRPPAAVRFQAEHAMRSGIST